MSGMPWWMTLASFTFAGIVLAVCLTRNIPDTTPSRVVPNPPVGLMPDITKPDLWLTDDLLLDEILATEVEALIDDIFAEKS